MLEWNVYIENFNKKEIEAYNVFNHVSYLKDLKTINKKYSKNEEEFKDQLKSSTMYYFWSKCEWEIILSDWPPSKPEHGFRNKKVCVYDQLKLNWKEFTDYVWRNRKELR